MPKQHKIKAAETILSIARKYGHQPDTIWNHQDNAKLRIKRCNPDRLHPDDIVVIPDIQTNTVAIKTENVSAFKLKISRGLLVRIRIDPKDEEVLDDLFVLQSTDRSQRIEKIFKQNKVSQIILSNSRQKLCIYFFI